MLTAPRFETSRLIYRAVEETDLEPSQGILSQLLEDPQVTLGLTLGAVVPLSTKKIRDWYSHSDKALFQAVFCLKPEELQSTVSDEGENTQGTSKEEAKTLKEEKSEKPIPIGWIVLDAMQFGAIHRKTSFGLGLLPKFGGHKYGQEAMEFLLERAFVGFGLNRVEGSLFEWNEPARKCYKAVYDHSVRSLVRSNHPFTDSKRPYFVVVDRGFTEEGRSRQAYWQQGGWRDEIHIGILASEWKARHPGVL